MPTTRPRHMITESDDIAHALDDAAIRWPDDAEHRGRLLRRLILEGQRAIDDTREQELAERRRRIAKSAGALTGVYEKDYLATLRQDWPE